MTADARPTGRAPVDPYRRGHLADHSATTLGWRTHHLPTTALRFLVGAVALGVFTYPILMIISGAFDGRGDPTQLTPVPGDPTLHNFEVATERGVWGFLRNSLVIAGGGLLLQMIVAVTAGYALGRHRFRGRALVLALVLSTLMLPEEVRAIPLAIILGDLPLLGIDLKGTALAVILPVGASAISILVMAAFIREVPHELEEAARIDGASELRILVQVILPLCVPALGVVAILGFIEIWDQYLLVLIAAKDTSDYTLTVALASLRLDIEVGYGVLLAGAFLALVPSLMMYLFLQKSLVRGITSGAVKG